MASRIILVEIPELKAAFIHLHWETGSKGEDTHRDGINV